MFGDDLDERLLRVWREYISSVVLALVFAIWKKKTELWAQTSILFAVLSVSALTSTHGSLYISSNCARD